MLQNIRIIHLYNAVYTSNTIYAYLTQLEARPDVGVGGRVAVGAHCSAAHTMRPGGHELTVYVYIV